MLLLITAIVLIVRVLSILIIVNVVFSYFLSPYHPVRETLDRFVRPMLEPIRRFIPPINGIDFSPLVLLLLIQVIGSLIVSVLRTL